MAPSVPLRSSLRRDRRGRAALALCLLVGTSSALADNATIPDTPAQLGLRGALDGALQLQVFINGRDSRQIVAATRDAQGRFLVKRSDLTAVGVKGGPGSGDSLVALESLAGLSYRYDETAQTLALSVPQELLAPHRYSAAPALAKGAGATADWGVALNYDVYASNASWWLGRRLAFGSGSLTLDGRASSPYGVFEQSGIVGATALSEQTALRLDSTWRYDDDGGDSYRAGDVINAGLPWTRPIRLGGVQVEHGFGLRPDLYTGPSATVSGTAAVPSSVDVFVNDMKLFSQPVDEGPFRIDNLPAVNGSGSATLVTRDVTGKETTTSAPFFVSSRLLAPGAIDYSWEAGYARRNYGVDSFDYDPHLISSASIRGGFTDWATVEAHAEGGAGLLNGGVGVTVDVFQRAVIEASLADSRFGGETAGQLGFGLSTSVFGAELDISTQLAMTNYVDLAEVTAPPGQNTSALAALLPTNPQLAALSPLLLTTSVAPPHELSRASLTVPRAIGLASLNVSLVDELDMDGSDSRIASVGVTRNFKNGMSAYATAFVDFAATRDFGLLAGLSYTFDNGVSASTQSGLQNGGFAQTTQVAKSAGQEVGDYGWSVADQEGAERYVEATAAYQSSFGRANFAVNQYGAAGNASATASAEFSGAAAFVGGAFAAAPHISDSFAMVDAGAPGVVVLEDNRPIGRTDSSGRLLAPNLRSFEDNKISVDPTTLPPEAQTAATELTLRPRAQSGLAVDFKVRARPRDAEVILVDEAGRPLTAGAQVERPGRPAAILGYDGRAYLSDLSAHNTVQVHIPAGACLAEFDYAPLKRSRPTLGPIVCRTVPAR